MGGGEVHFIKIFLLFTKCTPRKKQNKHTVLWKYLMVEWGKKVLCDTFQANYILFYGLKINFKIILVGILKSAYNFRKPVSF